MKKKTKECIMHRLRALAAFTALVLMVVTVTSITASAGPVVDPTTLMS